MRLGFDRADRRSRRLWQAESEYGVPVNGTLSAITVALALIVAVWAFIAAARNRPPDRSHLVGLAVVEGLLLVLVAVALAAVAGGERPASPVTFFGYVITILCLPPLGWVLARLEPTRWGATIIGVVCLTVPVLVLRLQQTWTAVTSG
jgi:hypothetical protein